MLEGSRMQAVIWYRVLVLWSICVIHNVTGMLQYMEYHRLYYLTVHEQTKNIREQQKDIKTEVESSKSEWKK